MQKNHKLLLEQLQEFLKVVWLFFVIFGAYSLKSMAIIIPTIKATLTAIIVVRTIPATKGIIP